MTETPVFASVQQALHISFLMEILPATQRSQMQVLIEALMKQCGVWDETPVAPKTIDFGGLSALEIRAQCAMVRGAVDHHLTRPERDAIQAAYGRQRTQVAGVRGVAAYAVAMTSTARADAVLALAWGLFCPRHMAADLSLRKIGEEFGLSKSTAHRDQQIIKQTHRSLLSRGIERLGVTFANSGLVAG